MPVFLLKKEWWKNAVQLLQYRNLKQEQTLWKEAKLYIVLSLLPQYKALGKSNRECHQIITYVSYGFCWRCAFNHSFACFGVCVGKAGEEMKLSRKFYLRLLHQNTRIASKVVLQQTELTPVSSTNNVWTLRKDSKHYEQKNTLTNSRISI